METIHMTVSVFVFESPTTRGHVMKDAGDTYRLKHCSQRDDFHRLSSGRYKSISCDGLAICLRCIPVSWDQLQATHDTTWAKVAIIDGWMNGSKPV